MNVVETTGYVAFFWMAATYGVFDGKRGKSRLFTMVWAGRKVEGTRGATMVLGLFGLSLVTVVKTIIYGECFLVVVTNMWWVWKLMFSYQLNVTMVRCC
jgi:hypothetical protein